MWPRLYIRYENWFERCERGTKMIVDVGEHDFVNETDDRTDVVARVERRLVGLLPE